MPLSEEAARIEAALNRMAIRPFNHFKVEGQPEVYETAEEAASAAFRKEIERQLRTSATMARTPGMTAEVIQEVAAMLDANFVLFQTLFGYSTEARARALIGKG